MHWGDIHGDGRSGTGRNTSEWSIRRQLDLGQGLRGTTDPWEMVIHVVRAPQGVEDVGIGNGAKGIHLGKWDMEPALSNHELT